MPTPEELLKDSLGVLDGGPIYAETLLEHGDLVFEPWNAWSSLLIAAPAVYWAWRLWGSYKDYLFLVCCMPFLFLNGMGSTFFHASRASDLLLLMDFMPAAIVTLMVSVYLWVKVLPHWAWVFPVILLSFLLRIPIFRYTAPPLSINLNYAVSGLTFLIPLAVLLHRMQYQGTGLILGTFAAFGAALLCREADAWDNQPFEQGTHFLWHAFTGVGGYLLGLFLYRLADRTRNTPLGADALSTDPPILL